MWCVHFLNAFSHAPQPLYLIAIIRKAFCTAASSRSCCFLSIAGCFVNLGVPLAHQSIALFFITSCVSNNLITECITVWGAVPSGAKWDVPKTWFLSVELLHSYFICILTGRICSLSKDLLCPVFTSILSRLLDSLHCWPWGTFASLEYIICFQHNACCHTSVNDLPILCLFHIPYS